MTQVRNADDFMASLGFEETYRVGGSVRDEILGRRPKDADYVIRNAPLDEIRARVAKAGAKPSKLQLRDGRVVGVRAAVRGVGLIEIALPRTEVAREVREGENKRHAFEIVTAPELPLARDAERRDFTVNALYKIIPPRHVNGWGDTPYGNMGIVDPTGRGISDLEHKLLNTTHPTSFRDDPLRTMRGLRFVAVLPGFELSKVTEAQMREHAPSVTGLAAKGVSGTALDELSKLLMGRRVAKALRLARDTGVLAVLLPELAPMLGFEQESKYHDMTTDEHTFTALDAAAGMHCDLRVRLALLFHDAGKPESAWMGDDGRLHYYSNGEKEDHEIIGARLASEALTRLNAPAKLKRDVITLVERHMVPINGRTKPAKVRKWRTEMGDELLADLFKHRLADCMGKGTVSYEAISAIARLEKIREDAEKMGVPVKAKDMPISGHDLIALGLEGPEIGRVQKQLLHEVVSQPDRNEREWLLGRAEKLAAKGRA